VVADATTVLSLKQSSCHPKVGRTYGAVASEQNLVAVLEQIIRGEGATCDTVNLGAINNEARELLAKWQDPDRDALHPYS
jgi:hypothetical protein